MTRRNFLALGIGAVAVVPVLGLANTTKRKNNEKLFKLAADYCDGSDVDRKRIIESLNYIVSEAESVNNFRVKKFVEGFRDALLTYNVIPAVEVFNA